MWLLMPVKEVAHDANDWEDDEYHHCYHSCWERGTREKAIITDHLIRRKSWKKTTRALRTKDQTKTKTSNKLCLSKQTCPEINTGCNVFRLQLPKQPLFQTGDGASQFISEKLIFNRLRMSSNKHRIRPANELLIKSFKTCLQEYAWITFN